MAYEYQSFATLGVNLNRQNYGALDISQVFNSQGDLDYYLSKGTNKTNVSDYWKNIVPYPYEGQIVSLVLEGDSETPKKVQVGVLQLDNNNNFIFSQLELNSWGSCSSIVIDGMGVPEELKVPGSSEEWNGEYDGWTFESGE